MQDPVDENSPARRHQAIIALLYSRKQTPGTTAFDRNKGEKQMIPQLTKHTPLAAAILLFSCFGSAPLLADEPTVLVQPEAGSSLSALLKNILGDTNRHFDRYQGPDDCSTEQLYVNTREMLGNYADAPEQNQDALRNYILASKQQCNCTRAIIGKDFDILVDAVGSDLSQVPCP
jgi:hypothetical protein